MKQKDDRVIRTYDQWVSYCLMWAEHDFEGDPRHVVNKVYVHPKTQKQNSTAHMLLNKLADEIGYERALFKRQFKSTYGAYEEVVGIDKVARIEPKSLEDYDKEEISKFIDMILFVASDFYGIVMEIKGESNAE